MNSDYWVCLNTFHCSSYIEPFFISFIPRFKLVPELDAILEYFIYSNQCDTTYRANDIINKALQINPDNSYSIFHMNPFLLDLFISNDLEISNNVGYLYVVMKVDANTSNLNVRFSYLQTYRSFYYSLIVIIAILLSKGHSSLFSPFGLYHSQSFFQTHLSYQPQNFKN